MGTGTACSISLSVLVVCFLNQCVKSGSSEGFVMLCFNDDHVVTSQDEEQWSTLKQALEINFKKTEYLSTTEGRVEDLEIGENLEVKCTEKYINI